MKNILFYTLILSIFTSFSFGQCDGNRIPLKKEGKNGRDWVNDYDNLEKKYSSKKETVSKLRNYFYLKDKPKFCISYDSLKLLQSDLGNVFLKTTNPDKLITELKAAINHIIKANPSGFISKKEPNILEQQVDIQTDTTKGFIEKESLEDVSIIENSNEKILKLEKQKKLWLWISIVSFLGFLGLLGLYFYDRKNHLQQFNINLKDFQANSKALFDEKEIWRNKCESLEKTKIVLEKQINDSKSNLSKFHSESQVEEITQTINKVIPQEPSKQFYLSIPTPSDDGLGIFRDMRQQQPNPTSSFYRFELERDETKAKFWFLDNPNTIQSAVIYPETYINPVCNYEGFNSEAKRIITKEPGVATKEGDIWKVRSKAKIRFE